MCSCKYTGDSCSVCNSREAYIAKMQTYTKRLAQTLEEFIEQEKNAVKEELRKSGINKLTREEREALGLE